MYDTELYYVTICDCDLWYHTNPNPKFSKENKKEK